MNLLQRLFNDPNPILWKDPTPKNASFLIQKDSQYVPSSKQERQECHELIDVVLKSNPEIQKRVHLITDICADLQPWTYDQELPHIMNAMRYLPTDKLGQMRSVLEDKETSFKRKASIKKTLLYQGYMQHLRSQINRQKLVQPLMTLFIWGTMFYGIHGMTKENDRQVAVGTTACIAGYLWSEVDRKKFFLNTKDAHQFLDHLKRNPDEKQKITTEYQQWFTDKKQNSL